MTTQYANRSRMLNPGRVRYLRKALLLTSKNNIPGALTLIGCRDKIRDRLA